MLNESSLGDKRETWLDLSISARRKFLQPAFPVRKARAEKGGRDGVFRVEKRKGGKS